MPSSCLSFLSLLFLSAAPSARGVGHVLNKGSVRSRDVAASFGRGYSMATGEVLNACILPPGSDEVTFNFDYDFSVVEMQSRNIDLQQIRSVTPDSIVSADWLASKMQDGYSARNETTKETHFIAAVLVVDKYYITPTTQDPYALSEDAKTILRRDNGNGNMVQFMQICGPTFVSSVRRTVELSILFQSKRLYSEQKDPVIQRMDNFLRHVEENEKMLVTVKAFGFPSREDSQFSLLINRHEDISGALNYGFESATRSAHVGMIKSVEVTPWTSNISFLATAVAFRQNLEYRVCYDSDDPSEWSELPCDHPDVQFREVRVFNQEVKKFNLLANLEHVLSIDAKIKRDSLMLSSLSNCLREFHSLSVNDRSLFYRGREGENADYVTGTALLEGLTTPAYDGALAPYAQRLRDLDSFVRGYYDTCTRALMAEDLGVSEGTLLTTHYSQLEACTDIMCTMPNSYYDEATGFCGLRQEDQTGGFVRDYCPLILAIPQPQDS